MRSWSFLDNNPGRKSNSPASFLASLPRCLTRSTKNALQTINESIPRGYSLLGLPGFVYNQLTMSQLNLMGPSVYSPPTGGMASFGKSIDSLFDNQSSMFMQAVERRSSQSNGLGDHLGSAYVKRSSSAPDLPCSSWIEAWTRNIFSIFTKASQRSLSMEAAAASSYPTTPLHAPKHNLSRWGNCVSASFIDTAACEVVNPDEKESMIVNGLKVCMHKLYGLLLSYLLNIDDSLKQTVLDNEHHSQPFASLLHSVAHDKLGFSMLNKFKSCDRRNELAAEECAHLYMHICTTMQAIQLDVDNQSDHGSMQTLSFHVQDEHCEKRSTEQAESNQAVHVYCGTKRRGSPPLPIPTTTQEIENMLQNDRIKRKKKKRSNKRRKRANAGFVSRCDNSAQNLQKHSEAKSSETPCNKLVMASPQECKAIVNQDYNDDCDWSDWDEDNDNADVDADVLALFHCDMLLSNIQDCKTSNSNDDASMITASMSVPSTPSISSYVLTNSPDALEFICSPGSFDDNEDDEKERQIETAQRQLLLKLKNDEWKLEYCTDVAEDDHDDEDIIFHMEDVCDTHKSTKRVCFIDEPVIHFFDDMGENRVMDSEIIRLCEKRRMRDQICDSDDEDEVEYFPE